MRVAVFDTGNPDKTTTTTVRIPVTRNVNTPRFNRQSYEATINENAAVGMSILKTEARDNDQVRILIMIMLSHSESILYSSS